MLKSFKFGNFGFLRDCDLVTTGLLTGCLIDLLVDYIGFWGQDFFKFNLTSIIKKIFEITYMLSEK